MSTKYRRLTQLVPPQLPSLPSRRGGARTLAFTFGLLAPSALFASNVAGNPQVAAGSVNFSQQGNIRTIEQQSGAAIINWNDFSIKAGDVTRFVQPGVNSAVLNRVLGANPSLLNGRLQANGSVYLINPNGVVVGPQGRIDVGAFFASTLDISDNDFLRGGDLRLHGDSRAGVENLGTINASAGDVMLIAYTTRNAGTVSAPAGTVGLAAGSEVLLTEKGDQRLLVRSGVSADKLASGVENSGLVEAARAELKAAGGLYQLAVNQSGVVRATGVENKNGRVLLTAGSGSLLVSGDISARNADGSGGEILVGGDYAGQNTAIANAASTRVTASATLDAGATSANASGGRVIVWADQSTSFAGFASARAGASGGDGGFIEVSGKRVLDFTGTADTSAPLGKRGTLLLDPDAVIIGTAADQDLIMQGPFIQAQALPSFLNNGTLNSLLAITDVEIRTGDSVFGPAGFNGISVNADLGWTSTSNLKLVSGDTIAINANINAANSGSLTLMPGSVAAADSSTGAVTLGVGSTITVNTLSIEKSLLASTNGADIGAITFAGVVNASVVELVRNSGGVTGDITFSNAANQIGTLRGTGSNGAITGALRVNDSAGGLTIAGDFSNISGAVDVSTSGDLTVATGARVNNTGSSDLVLASRDASFINLSDATAIEASGAGRYLIYSDTPTNTTRGGLTGATTYNRTYAANAPGTITATGDRFLYSFAPTLTFSADSTSRLYGSANPAFNFTVAGLQPGDTLGAAYAGTPALSTTATTASGVSTVPITIANGSLAATDLGYQFAFQPGSLTINPAPLTITANGASRLYGSANPAFSASFSGLVNSDTSAVVSGLSLASTATSSTGIGAYPITASGASAANYAISFQPGSLTINPAPLTITANNASRLFGVANPAFSALFDGLVNGDNTSVVSGLSLSTTAGTGSPVGNYPITASGATAANYSISFQPGTLNIANALLTITADDFSRVYGAANPAFTASYSGFINSDTPSVVSGLQFSTAATFNSGVGSYTITPFGASAPNYGINYVSGSLSITPADLTIRANDFARPYGSANPAFTGTFTGLVAGDTPASISGVQFTTTANAATGIGGYTINTSGAANPNYTITQQLGTLTINRAPLTIAADNQSRAYGAANPALTATFTGLVNSDTSAVVSGLTLATTAAPGSNVGSYPITASGAAAANYQITFAPGTFSVSAAPLTITANSLGRTYGAANPTLTASFTGLVNGDTPANAFSGLTLSTTATPASNVGSYPITPAGATSTNYALTFTPGTLSVNQAPLTITANSLGRTYGAANPTLTASFTGLVNGDTSANAFSGLTLSTTATPASGVGSYPITPAGATSTNYALTFTPGTLSVNRAPLTIIPNSANRPYGAANPAFTAEATGLVNGDTLAGAVSGLSLGTTATLTSGVGVYPISASGGTAANYTLAYDTGTLAIDRAVLTLTATNATRVYGDANPAFTLGGITGFVLGEDASVLTAPPVFTTTATLTSNVGNYPITGSAAAANYSFDYVPGTLSITPAALAVRADNFTRFYGDANPAFTYSVSGLKNSDTADGKFFINVLGSTAPQTASAGSYAIQLSGLDVPNDNYTTTFAGGTLTIARRPLTIRPDDVSRLYGDSNPTLGASFIGLAPIDTPASISNLQLVASASAFSNAGSYPITASNAVAPNYSITYEPGVLTVNKAPLTITVGDATRLYGDANPAFDAILSGFRNGDSSSALGGTVGTTATTSSNVGAYPITFTGTPANYDIIITPATLTVNPVPLSITVNSTSRLYGSANPELTATYSGFRNGDTPAALTGALGTTATLTSNTGVYPVTFTGTATNYTITTTPGRLVVNPAPLDITIPAVSRLYGDANPTIPYDVQGLLFGREASAVLSIVSTATPTSPVGTYDLFGSSFDPNYVIRNFTSTGLQVAPRPVTLQFDTIRRPYGDANPSAFNYTLSGSLASFDTVSTVLGATAGASTAGRFSDIGVYPITQSSTANPNYAFTTSGAVRVFARPVTLSVGNAANYAGQPLPAFSATATNLPVGLTLSQVFPSFAFTTSVFTEPVTTGGVTLTPATPADAATSVTSSLINPTGYEADTNYNVTNVVPGVLTTTSVKASTIATELSLTLPDKLTLSAPLYTPPPPLTPAEIWAQGSSFGLPPSANGILLDLIKNQLAFAVAVGETEMLRTLLGDNYAELTKDGKITEETLIAAIAGFHQNKEKQALILPTLLEAVTKMAEPGAILSANQKQVLDAVAPFVAKARDEVVSNVEAAKEKWFEDRKAAADAAPIALVSEYTPIYPPYNEFLKIATEEAVARRISNINLGAGLGGAAGGALAGSAGLAAAYTITGLHTAIFSAKSSASVGSGMIAGAGVGSAGAIMFVAAAAGIVAGTAQTITAAVAENRYNELLEQKGQPVNLAGFNTGKKSKSLIAAALLGMMSGGVSLPPSR